MQDGHTDDDALVDVPPTPDGRPIGHEMLGRFEDLVIGEGTRHDEAPRKTGAQLETLVGRAQAPTFRAVAPLRLFLPVGRCTEELHPVNRLRGL